MNSPLILQIDADASNRLFMRFAYAPDIIEAIKTIPSRKWDAEQKVHYVGKYDLPLAVKAIESFGYLTQFSPRANVIMSAVAGTQKRMKDIKEGKADMHPGTDLKLPLRPFQQVGFEYLLAAKKCLLCDEMGCGKTVQSVAVFKYLKEQGKVRKMLVLCPSSVKGAWKKDIAKFTDLKHCVIDGLYEERKASYATDYDILIMSYETYLEDFGMKDKGSKRKPREPIPFPEGIDMLACDEAQRMVKSKNKITQSLLILKEKISLSYIYIMTGTPLVNKVEDLHSLLYFINPEIVGEFWGFRSRYCVVDVEKIKVLDRAVLAKTGKYVKKELKIPHVVGYKNLEELKEKIAPFYIRREKKDVLTDLPDKIPMTLEIELNKEQRSLYNENKARFLDRFRNEDVTGANALTWFVRAKQICDSAEILDPGSKSSAKLDELRGLLDDLIVRDNHKVVLFSQYREMTDILVREFADHKPLYLHGGTKDSDRPILVDTFQEDPEYKLFVSTLRAGGVGITLTAADIVILYDRWFSPAVNNQAIDRVHRIGQDKPVTVINFLCRDTLEERIEEILVKKKQMFDGMFGDDVESLGHLTSAELKALL